MSDIILYTPEDGRSRIQLRAKGQTVWLTQREMAELFDVSTDNVGLHLKNLYEEGELSREGTTEESSVVQLEGTREVQRPVTLYNLDAILAVGYRVRSPRGVQFRRWASIRRPRLHERCCATPLGPRGSVPARMRTRHGLIKIRLVRYDSIDQRA